jgi:hypothetical protein
MALVSHHTINHILPDTEPDSELHKWISETATSASADSPSGLVIPYYVLDPENEEAALLAILRCAFATSPSLQTVILVSNSELPLAQPFLLKYFTLIGSRGPSGEVAYSTSSDAVHRGITVRAAIVEDTDDLVPLVVAAADRFGSLAKVALSPTGATRRMGPAATTELCNHKIRCVVLAYQQTQCSPLRSELTLSHP